MSNPDDGAWFAPKTIGYGSGLPIAWQGWAFMAAHVALIVGGAFLLRESPAASIVWTFSVAVIALPLYAAKTRGGWKWRSGKPKR